MPLYSYLFLMNLAAAIVIFIAYMIGFDRKRYVKHAQFIQGIWQRKGISPEGEPWQIEYQFTPDLQFSINANPPLHSNGKYRILKEIENLLIVELYHIEGDKLVHHNHLPVAVDTKHQLVRIEDRVYRWKD